LGEEFVLNGVIEKIREIEKAAKCPFCGNQLSFKRFDKTYWSDNPRITLRCKKCQINIKLARRKHGFFSKRRRWELIEVEKARC
jgi:hypothetical protein